MAGTFTIGNNATEQERVRELKTMLDDARMADNPLLPLAQQIYKLYQQLQKRADKLLKENLALKIELGETARSLDLASRVDALTGLANRRQIAEKIEQEISRSERHHHPLTLMLVDIDDFRELNDRHGYNVGDDVLVELARVLTGTVRGEDVCGRWEGGSFLVLLPETNAAGAERVAQKLLKAVAMTEFRANHPGVRLTVSAGLCQHQPGESVTACIAAVNAALRGAKHAGKNRCVRR